MHFHYVLSMGVVITILMGIRYYLPNICGIVYKFSILNIEYIHYYLLLISVNIIFFPMHIIGINGLPRRYSDYNINFSSINILISYGSILSLFSMFLYFYILESLIRNCFNRYIYLLNHIHSSISLYFINKNTSNSIYRKIVTLSLLHSSYSYHHTKELPII